jgi:hypothetical protein
MLEAAIRRHPQRLEAAELSWPLPAELEEVALAQCQFLPSPVRSLAE